MAAVVVVMRAGVMLALLLGSMPEDDTGCCCCTGYVGDAGAADCTLAEMRSLLDGDWVMAESTDGTLCPLPGGGEPQG